MEELEATNDGEDQNKSLGFGGGDGKRKNKKNLGEEGARGVGRHSESLQKKAD